MKKLMLLALVMFAPVVANAGGLAWQVGGDYAVSISTSLDLDTVGAYDFANKEWLTGLSKDLLVLWKKDQKRAYLAGEQLFSVDEQFKGSFGLALGIMTGTLTEWGYKAAEKIIPEASMPAWVKTAGNWVSIEGGGGYRIAGTPEGKSPWCWTVGGKVRIPISMLVGK